jgi:hypothetical protein
MATAARRPSGTFASEYDDLGLYTLVRIIAEFVSPDEPTLITMAAWDAGREPSGHPHAPSARAICARLADRDGNRFPWRELLELVFEPARNIEQTHALRHRRPEADHFTEQHLYYALRRVASELKTQSPGPDAYARKREQLIADDRRRGVDLLEELLPTVGQVERIAGSWEAGLELAGLDSRAGNGVRRPSGRRHHWTLERCVDAVRRYHEGLRAGRPGSKKGYLAWSVGRADVPAPATFDRYGGWKRVAALARGSEPVPHVPTKAEQVEGAVLQYIDAHGQISSGELQTLLGVSEHVAGRVLKRMKAAGQIIVGSEHNRGRSVFYVRAGV